MARIAESQGDAKVTTLYMETTKIPAKRTASQISELLGDAGACAVMIEYNADREIAAVSFQLMVNEKPVPFTMPIRTEPIAAILRRKRRRASSDVGEQASRVAWRQAFRWLQAQLAIIETGMVRPEEAFLPYMLVEAQTTLYQRMASGGFDAGKLLARPKEMPK